MGQAKQLTESLSEMLVHFRTQRAIAMAAGVKPASVNDWFSGKTKPSMRSLIKIEKESKRKFKAKEIRPELFD